MTLRSSVVVVLIVLTFVLAQASNLEENSKQKVSSVLAATDNEDAIDSLHRSISIQRQNARAFNRKRVTLGIAAAIACVFFLATRVKPEPKKLIELKILEELPHDAQRLADIIGTDRAQRNSQIFSTHIVAAQTAGKELEELQTQVLRSPSKEKAILKTITGHVSDSIKLIRSLHAGARRCAKASAMPKRYPHNAWEIMGEAVSKAAGEEFVDACKEALRAAEDELTMDMTKHLEAKHAITESPGLSTAQQGWFIQADVELLLGMKIFEERADQAAKLLEDVNKVAFETLKELSIRRSLAGLQTLEEQNTVVIAWGVVAKAAIEHAGPEDKAALAAFAEEAAALQEIHKRFQDEQATLKAMTKPSDVVAAIPKLSELYDASFAISAACFNKAVELENAINAGRAAYPAAAQILKGRAVTAVERIKQVNDEISGMVKGMLSAHKKMLAELPLSTKIVYGRKVAERLYASLTQILQYTSQVYKGAQVTAGKLEKAKSLKKAVKWTSIVHDKASRAESLALFAAAISHAANLLIVMEKDMAASFDAVLPAQHFPFSAETKAAADEVLRNFRRATRDALKLDTLDRLGEAQYYMRASATKLNVLMFLDRLHSASKSGMEPSQVNPDDRASEGEGAAGQETSEVGSTEQASSVVRAQYTKKTTRDPMKEKKSEEKTTIEENSNKGASEASESKKESDAAGANQEVEGQVATAGSQDPSNSQVDVKDLSSSAENGTANAPSEGTQREEADAEPDQGRAGSHSGVSANGDA